MVSVGNILRTKSTATGVSVGGALRGSSTAIPDTTPPAIQTLSPADDATSVAIGASLVATFDEPIQFGATVEIELRLASDDSVVEAWDETDIDSGISIAGAALTIDPASNLDYLEEYYVHIASGSIEDMSGNVFAGLTGTDWSFTARDEPTADTPTANFSIATNSQLVAVLMGDF
jgi:large repetitive protein